MKYSIVICLCLTLMNIRAQVCFDPELINSNICPTVEVLVCGCNDVTYSNSCEANKNGIAIYSNGPCSGKYNSIVESHEITINIEDSYDSGNNNIVTINNSLASIFTIGESGLLSLSKDPTSDPKSLIMEADRLDMSSDKYRNSLTLNELSFFGPNPITSGAMVEYYKTGYSDVSKIAHFTLLDANDNKLFLTPLGLNFTSLSNTSKIDFNFLDENLKIGDVEIDGSNATIKSNAEFGGLTIRSGGSNDLSLISTGLSDINVTSAKSLNMSSILGSSLDRIRSKSQIINNGDSYAIDAHISQSTQSSSAATNSGLYFESGNQGWKIYFSGSHLSFADGHDNGFVRRAYIEDDTGDWMTSSDLKFKEQITNAPEMLEKVLKLNSKLYKYKNASNSAPFTIGFVAQEVENFFPSLVGIDENGDRALSYSKFGVIAIKAIQEQQKVIQHQSSLINKLLESNAEIINRIQHLENR